jgi:hypothetical protein
MSSKASAIAHTIFFISDPPHNHILQAAGGWPKKEQKQAEAHNQSDLGNTPDNFDPN